MGVNTGVEGIFWRIVTATNTWVTSMRATRDGKRSMAHGDMYVGDWKNDTCRTDAKALVKKAGDVRLNTCQTPQYHTTNRKG